MTLTNLIVSLDADAPHQIIFINNKINMKVLQIQPPIQSASDLTTEEEKDIVVKEEK